MINKRIPFSRETPVRDTLFGRITAVYPASCDVQLVSGAQARKVAVTDQVLPFLTVGRRCLLLWDPVTLSFVCIGTLLP